MTTQATRKPLALVTGASSGIGQAFAERERSQPFPWGIVMKPEKVVQASLAGLKLGEAICVPAMEDPNVLA